MLFYTTMDDLVAQATSKGCVLTLEADTALVIVVPVVLVTPRVAAE